MKRFFAGVLSLIYSFLSLFGLSFNDGERIWTENLIFSIEKETDIFCPDNDVWVNGTQYPAVIRLSNGTLLASFEHFSKIKNGFTIKESKDNGDTWKEISFVTETFDKSVNASWNPFLLELPEKIGEYEKGTVILAGVSIDSEQSRKSQISLYKSTDFGQSWDEISVVDFAGGTGEGVWEPFLTYENGYLYCFYSDDSDEKYSQTIVYKRSKDLKKWESKNTVVCSADPDDRPGMPVLTKMNNGKWFLCYEFGNGDGYPVYYKTSERLDDWNSFDIGKKIVSKTGKTIGSAPYCIWISAGGKQGTLIVSGKYGNSIDNDLFISNNYGKSFLRMKNPLDYSDNQGCGYHASFFWSEKEKKLFYANTVEFTDTLSKISFARISVTER